MDKVTEKRCPKCGEVKGAGEFHKTKRTKDGLQSWCKVCTKTRYKEDVDKRKAYLKKNREERILKMREYYMKNQDKILLDRKKFYTKNREKIKRRVMVYEKIRMRRDPLYAAMRRSRGCVRDAFRRVGLTKPLETCQLVGCSTQELLMRWGVDSIPKSHHIDHICPLSQAQNVEEIEKLCHYTNLQLLLGTENQSKSDKPTEEGVRLCRELLGREWI